VEIQRQEHELDHLAWVRTRVLYFPWLGLFAREFAGDEMNICHYLQRLQKILDVKESHIALRRFIIDLKLHKGAEKEYRKTMKCLGLFDQLDSAKAKRKIYRKANELAGGVGDNYLEGLEGFLGQAFASD